MSFTAIFNCDLFTPDQCVAQGLVLIERNQIRAVGHSHEIPLPADTRLLDAQGGRVTPGLIDLGGVSSVNQQMAARGVTSSVKAVWETQWGIPDEVTIESGRYYLATIDHVRSANPSVLRTLLSSHHLILAGNEAEPLNTRSIRQLMASADTDFASALAAATLAPAKFLDLPLGLLAAGTPADLICWTRHGDLAWTMVNGEIVYP